ncbi:MAG: hypothetical protein KDE15_13440 [Erythrobacter sp.]|nr:hypothetical protein [Erythrobacter sp.]
MDSPSGEAEDVPHSPPAHLAEQLAARLARLLCRFNRHQPPGKRAEWNGEAYVSHCRHCGQPIVRLARGRWRLSDQRRGVNRM